MLIVALAALPLRAGDAETHKLARETAMRAIEFLRSTQDGSGGWSVNPDGPDFPAITALAVHGMLLDPRIDERDPSVRAGIAHVLSFARPDGGIHDGFLPTYNTAVCVSMLAHVRTPEAARAVQGGLGLLKRMQWGAFDPSGEPSPEAPDWSEPVDRDHPYYGGLGYGRHGRPDLSNTQFFIQALHDAGVSTEDPAYERALVFLRRVQMDDRVNPMPYARGSRQGGFIYATVPDAESVDSVPGQSQAGEMVETLPDGSDGVRLRAYGSMTYAGFKSLLYADLARDDERVTAALGWIERHFTVSENPGLGDQGLYYNYTAMSRALDAWGEPAVAGRDWRGELVRRIASMQDEDGGFGVVHDRWMESDRNLIAAYALIALAHATR